MCIHYVSSLEERHIVCCTCNVLQFNNDQWKGEVRISWCELGATGMGNGRLVIAIITKLSVLYICKLINLSHNIHI